MYLTIHTPLSLIIGSKTNHPLLAFILAFIAHLILDAIPHDPFIQKNYFFIIACIDLILLFIFLYTLIKKDKLKLNKKYIYAIAGGIVPDALWFLSYLIKHKIKILEIYSYFHHTTIHTLISPEIFIHSGLAILIQSIVFILALYIYLKNV